MLARRHTGANCLAVSNCLFNKTSQLGYAFDGCFSLSNCDIECASNWFNSNSTSLILQNCTGTMLNGSASYFTLGSGATGYCLMSDCGFARGAVMSRLRVHI